MVPLTETERLQEIMRFLDLAAEQLDATARRIDRVIRESDRRAEEYLPILRRAGIVPSGDVPPRWRPWWW